MWRQNFMWLPLQQRKVIRRGSNPEMWRTNSKRLTRCGWWRNDVWCVKRYKTIQSWKKTRTSYVCPTSVVNLSVTKTVRHCGCNVPMVRPPCDIWLSPLFMDVQAHTLSCPVASLSTPPQWHHTTTFRKHMLTRCRKKKNVKTWSFRLKPKE